MHDLKRQIADDLIDAPAWSRSYTRVKAIVNQMVKDGDLVRVVPVGGRRRNMIALTEQGARRYHPGRKVFIGVPPPMQPPPPPRKVWDRTTVDRLAELVSEGLSLRAAYAQLGLSQSTGQRIWKLIMSEVGEA